MLPNEVGPQHIVLVVLSKHQWDDKNQQNYYKAIFNRESASQLAIAVADDELLPDSGADVSNRRLVSMRIALKLLSGVEVDKVDGSSSSGKQAAESFDLKIAFKQW